MLIEFNSPANAQRLEDVSLWYYFGRNVPKHNRTVIGRVRFLTSFGSAISDIKLK